MKKVFNILIVFFAIMASSMSKAEEQIGPATWHFYRFGACEGRPHPIPDSHFIVALRGGHYTSYKMIDNEQCVIIPTL